MGARRRIGGRCGAGLGEGANFSAIVQGGRLMAYWKSFGLALFAAVGLLSEARGSARAEIYEYTYAVEWSNGNVINLGGLSGYTSSSAAGINDAGQVVGTSTVGNRAYATEWRGDNVTNLGGLSGAIVSSPVSINNIGQAVGATYPVLITVGPDDLAVNHATEWSGDSIINLGGLPGATYGAPSSINDLGQVAGTSEFPPPVPVPESSSWAMMLMGFAGLGFAGYRLRSA